jgi:hypothetical protein
MNQRLSSEGNMKKPMNITSVKIVLPEGTKPEDAQKFTQMIIAKIEKERREYEIYEQGRRDASRGILGVLGL